MPSRSARSLSLILFAVLATAGSQALAQQGRDQDRGGQRDDDRLLRAQALQADRQSSDRRSDHQALSAAVRRVERRTGGQVLSAERVPYEGRSLNRVKVVDSTGRVRIYMDDPRDAGDQAPRKDAQRADRPPSGGRTRGDDS